MATKPVKKTEKTKTAKTAKKQIVKEKQVETAVSKPTKQPAEKVPLVESKRNADRGVLLLGFGLLFFGAILLAGRFLNIGFGDYIWPFLFITPGMLVLIAALSSDDRHGEGLAILGSILTSLGLVFLFQSVTDNLIPGIWATWAYAWALIAPTSVGIGQVMYGANKHRDSIRTTGTRLINIGLAMFGTGFVFFEIILGISGFGLKQFGIPVFPMILIFVGGFLLIRSIIRNR